MPFTIDLDTERIEMNTLAGDDTIAVKPGLAGRLGVLADGGSGNDRIEARNGAADSIEGGSGSRQRRRRPRGHHGWTSRPSTGPAALAARRSAARLRIVLRNGHARGRSSR